MSDDVMIAVDRGSGNLQLTTAHLGREEPIGAPGPAAVSCLRLPIVVGRIGSKVEQVRRVE
jgi:hypothetical protein